GVAPGNYWLESVADPLNHIVESNDGNNATRILITVGVNGQPDNAGNTQATARDIGTLSSTQTFQDFVGPVDTNDYYKFTLGSSPPFRLDLDALAANADVQLLNSSGTVLASSTQSSITPDSLSSSLAAGTYYVRVFPQSTATPATMYTLT